MAPEQLAEIKKRCEAATKGPWITRRVTNAGISVGQYEIPGLDFDEIGRCVWENLLSCDHDFIAHAREDIPALVAEIERLTAVEQRLARANTPFDDCDTDIDIVQHDRGWWNWRVRGCETGPFQTWREAYQDADGYLRWTAEKRRADAAIAELETLRRDIAQGAA